MEPGSILVVDDEESIRFTFQNFLEDEGYRVATAVSYDEAMEILDKDVFDLVYVDIILGGTSGIELLRDIKKGRPATEVIMVTGAPTVETASTALRLGALDYVVKPVRHDTLLRSAAMAFKHIALIRAKESCRLNLEAIFRSVQDVVITVDHEMRVVEVNPAAEKLCGIERAEALGSSLESWNFGCSTACLDALRQTLATGKPVSHRHLDCASPNHGARIVNVTATPLISRDGAPYGGVLVVRDETRIHELEASLSEHREARRIVGRSEAIRRVLSEVTALAEVKTSVLITGESGTGKELVAEALHALGPWRDRPMVKVNCSALSENLLESELFGHVRGAFTGADRNKIGRFERANGGTIFLDEIGDISPRMQLLFLRVLESMEFERVGDSNPVTVDVRVIAATNRDLKRKVTDGEFREDLYYRLKVFEIRVPPLRERRDDVPVLVQHFMERFNAKFSKEVTSLSDDVMDLFLASEWPGNVRQLENTLEHAYVLCGGSSILRRDLPADFTIEARSSTDAGEGPLPGAGIGIHEVMSLDEIERRYLEWAVRAHGGERADLAERLGLSERTLYRKLQRARTPDHEDGEP
jgi:PAS domain S-box-containing protein